MTIQATAITALAAASQRAASAAEGVRRAAAPPVETGGDSASLSEEAVRLLAASRESEAAVELARTADELTQTTIDLLA
jgi:hypothetical protein